MSTIDYRPDIDALRGLSVLLVVLYHALDGVLPGGFVGVDVFFVISGYLITGIIVSEIERGTFTFRGFYARRIRRIFPALFLVLMTTLAVGWLVLFPAEFATLGEHVFAASIFLQNFNLMQEIGYFDTASHYKPLLHLWTLSIEEQYYVLWPALIVLLTWFRLDKSLYLFLFIVPSFLLAVALVGERPDHVFYNSLSRFWELGLGSWLAVALPPGQRAGGRERLRSAGFVAGVALIVAAAVFVDGDSGYPAWPALLPVLGAMLVIVANVRLPAWGGLVQLGLISYPLYLWHWVILSFCQIYTGTRPPAPVIALAVAVAVLLSFLTYRYVERLRHARSSAVPLGLIGIAIVIGLSGYGIHASGGLPSRPQVAHMAQHQPEFRRQAAADRACHDYVGQTLGRRPAFPYCRTANLSRSEKRIAVIGDSHAHVLFPGMAEAAARHGYGAVLLAGSSCPMLQGFMTGASPGRVRGCQLITEQVLEVLRRDPAIERVVFTSRGPRYVHGKIDGPLTEESVARSLATWIDRDRVDHAALRQGFRNTFSALERMPHIDSVHYLTENPELGFHPKEILRRPFDYWGVSARPATVSRELHAWRMQRYLALVREAAAGLPSVSVIDVASILCATESCWIMYQDRFLYADRHHLSVHGSRFIAQRIEDIVFEEAVVDH